MTKQQIRNSFKTHFKNVEGYFKDENSTGYLKLDERIVDWVYRLCIEKDQIESGDDGRWR